MNNMSPGDFGDSQDLLRALGLINSSGGFEGAWLRNPETYLKRILADDTQRQALLDFVARARGGSVEMGPGGRQWVPLFERSFDSGSAVSFFIVFDDQPVDQVHLFLGVRFSTQAPLVPSQSSLMLPLFRAAKGSGAVGSPELMGQPGGKVAVTTEIELAATPAVPGQAGLRAVGLQIEIPTTPSDGDPVIAVDLRGLQLPGESAGRDISLSVTDPSDMQSEALNLLIALVQAQINGAGATTLRALARLLGLDNSTGIPRLPIEHGLTGLGNWLAQTFGAPASRTAWMQALADLFGNGAVVSNDEISLPLGPSGTPGQVKLAVIAATGAAGGPVITLHASAGFTDGTVEMAFRSDIVRIDLGTQMAVAVPQLRTDLTIDTSGLQLGSDVDVDAIALGFALDKDREPIFILELQNARIFTTQYDRLDLTNPDALAAAGTAAAGNVLGQVLTQLGPAGDLIGVALGIRRPTGAPASYPVVDLLNLLSDPLGILAAHWRNVLDNHAAQVTQVLNNLRHLLTGDATANSVTGSGTDADPWRLPLEAGVYLAVWRDDDGRLLIGLGLHKSLDSLGDRCTVLDTRLRVALVALDLANRHAGILPEIVLQGSARARGGGRLELGTTPIRVTVDHFGFVARWTPDAALSIQLDAPNPQLTVDDLLIPLNLPDFSGDFNSFIASVTEAQWELLETVAVKLADMQPGGWVSDLMDMLGWRRTAQVLGTPDRHRLALADLIDDAGAALRTWLVGLLADADARIDRHLRPLARLLGGHGAGSVAVEGRGTLQDPWRLILSGAPGIPALAVWRQPDAAPPRPDPVATRDLRRWRPGAQGLSPQALAHAIGAEYPEIAGAFGDVNVGPALDEALSTLATFWQGSDGRIPPLMTAVAGTTVHISANETSEQILQGIDLSAVFGSEPATVIRVLTLSAAQALPAHLDLSRVLDMRDPIRDPLAYAPLPDQSGEWHVILPPRGEVQLASGAPDGTAGQVQRLSHALSEIAGQPEATVVAAPGAGHTAWKTLEAMGSGLNRLVAVGLPVDPSQVPTALNAAAGETLRRLAEIIPHPDASQTDDTDLAVARRLLASHLEAPVGLDDLALPQGWNPVHRNDLDIHLVYGVMSQRQVHAAMTAMVAAGLSLHAQARNAIRTAMDITSASVGLYLPLNSSGTSGLHVKGHALAELLGTDVDLAARAVNLRQARHVSVACELCDASGWLIGGPSAGTVPLDIELRSVEIEVQTTIGGVQDPKAKRARMILHGARIGGLSYPRLEVSVAASGGLGIDGDATPAAPEILRMLEQVFQRANAATAPEIRRVVDALKFANIIDDDGDLDPLSLANWLDDPSARLRERLALPDARARLLGLISAVIGSGSGVSFDSTTGTLTITLTGSTGFPVFDEWALSATLSTSGVYAAILRLGPLTGTHITANLAPFGLTLNLTAQDAAAYGNLPRSLPLWPAPDVMLMARALLPQLLATATSEILTGLRSVDVGVRSVLDNVFTALGMLSGPAGDRRVIVPARVFIDPAAWLRSAGVLGNAMGQLDPASAIALMDALRQLNGFSGGSGRWDIATGIALQARADGQMLVVELLVDENSFMPAADVDCGGSFGIGITPDGHVQPQVALFVGLAGNTAGRKAVHLTVNGSTVRLFLRDGAGNDLEIYPTLANISQLVSAGLQAALPLALDAIVDTNSDIGRLVAHIGDALNLRNGGNFDADELSDWLDDPALALRNRWGNLLSNNLPPLLTPLLPSGVTVVSNANAITLSISDVGTTGSHITVTFQTNPEIWLEFGVSLANLPVVEELTATLRFDQTGLTRLQSRIGPAVIPLGQGISLRPVVEIDVDSAASPKFISVGLASDASLAAAVLEARYNFGNGFLIQFNDSSDAGDIAAGIMRFVIDLLGGFVLDLQPVRDLLTVPVGQNSTIRDVLKSVILDPTGAALDSELFRFVRNAGESDTEFAQSKLKRVFTLLDNLVSAGITVDIDTISISLTKTSGVLGIGFGLGSRFTLVDGDVSLWLENDNTWIIGTPPAGVTVSLARISGQSVQFQPGLAVNGLGVRVGGANKPLLERPIGIGSIALHIYADISQTTLKGGAQVELAELAVGVGAGGAGGNPVASGLLSETSGGQSKLAPAFSPALSVQSRPSGSGAVIGFRAGQGDGPWWLPIRQQFGPLYVGQIGIGRQMHNDRLKTLSVLFDGNVSIAGLTAAVDDLELRHDLDAGGIFDADAWEVDLAGLAVSADLSGVSLSGGLRKLETPVPGAPPGSDPMVEYIGMLNARFGTYGLSIYGGYAEVPQTQTAPSYTSFFAYGSVLGPFGGPPAFFLTGIGGGFGINREISPPTDMSDFNTFPLIKALDPSATSNNPMEELNKVRDVIRNKRGTFWFAAGISFTSFMIVDGIAVVMVEFGNGFELAIFGLARAALPRPEAALVSLELGLVARFSTSEGVIWIQAQLTENSWLLHPSARLTGGFAYVSWFDGDKKGEFVLTLGGYHPNFHRDGYPTVPRLGFNWSASSAVSIKAETYFALTSEAIMAGGLFEASAKYGPAYANLSFGGNALVYFDPFSYEADAHARISAGIRIKTWLGTVRLSFSLGAAIEVRGPEFHGTARVEVGPIDITVRFGNSSAVPGELLAWHDFVKKYLELASGDSARALSGIAGRGALPPKSSGSQEGSVPDGSSARPYEVASEFELSFTSTIPFDYVKEGGDPERPTITRPNLGVAPSGYDIEKSTLILRLHRVGQSGELLNGAGIDVTIRETGRFPIGVWGPAPDTDQKKIPKGEVIHAAEGVNITFTSSKSPRLPSAPDSKGVAFNQVEAGDRKPLPLKAAGSIRSALIAEAKAQRQMLGGLSAEQMQMISESWKLSLSTPTEAVAWRRARTTPMRVGMLSDRIVGSTASGTKRPVRTKRPGVDVFTFGDATLRGVLRQKLRLSEATMASAATRVTANSALARGKLRVAPPRVKPELSDTISDAVLLKTQISKPVQNKTLINGLATAPETISAQGAVSVVKGRASKAQMVELAALEATANGRAGRSQSRDLHAGDIAVFDLPGAQSRVRFSNAGALALKGGAARVVVLGAAGRVLINRVGVSRLKLPSGARSFAVLAGDDTAPHDVAGWIDSSRIAYLGNQMARGAGAFIRAEGASRTRGGNAGETGWIIASVLTDQSALIETTFDRQADTVAVLLDGPVTEKELDALSVRIRGREVNEEAVMLVPVNGKTLIVYPLTGRADKVALSVTVAGWADARLDGVMAAGIPAEALVSRFLKGVLALETDTTAQGAAPVTLRYRPPAAVRVPQEI